jgi:hypothetical protein
MKISNTNILALTQSKEEQQRQDRGQGQNRGIGRRIAKVTADDFLKVLQALIHLECIQSIGNFFAQGSRQAFNIHVQESPHDGRRSIIFVVIPRAIRY